ncbi:hypothetical protein BLNAU_13542 [Blattamonas nauphoetae]|uniref:Uncharacterized protein n=1 Tax=Blattamonas nauphoetae TaxID=2049346 RepID=A0ABQ9XN10_9EUKA|nr:hypothetical protein BLNAU_13542 [Blattamonas nauphoetae]
MIVLKKHSLGFTSLVFSSFTGPRHIHSVFEVSNGALLHLSSCSLSSSFPVSLSFANILSSGSLHVDSLLMSQFSFSRKGSVVRCSGSSAVTLTQSSFSSVSLDDGGIAVGTTTKAISITNSNFTNCSGKAFGSLIRVEIVGSSMSLVNCWFEMCSTRVCLEEREGGLASIASRDSAGRAVLRHVLLSNCTVSNMVLAHQKGFNGGVVGWTHNPLWSDGRGMVVVGCSFGAVQLAHSSSSEL